MDYREFTDAWPSVAEREWINQMTAEVLEGWKRPRVVAIIRDPSPFRCPAVVHIGVVERRISLYASAAALADLPCARLVGVDLAIPPELPDCPAELIQGDSMVVGAGFDGGVAFLFIDGDHSRRGVIGDLLTWTPHVIIGGIVALHDYGNHLLSWCCGVKEAVDAWDWTGWEMIPAVDSIRAYRRVV
jgi:hypothetical protein